MHKKSMYTEIQWDSLVDHITEVHGLMDPTTQGIIERMNDYVVALREDKQRLDWLLNKGGTVYTNRGKGYISLSGNENYRADIDAAMKEGEA